MIGGGFGGTATGFAALNNGQTPSTRSTSARSVIWIDDQAGASFTAKFLAAFLAAQNGTFWTNNRPVLMWDTTVNQTIDTNLFTVTASTPLGAANPVTLFDGFAIEGSSINHAEFSPTDQAQLTIVAPGGLFALKSGASVWSKNVSIKGILFALSGATTSLFQEITDGAAGPILAYSQIDGISVTGGKSVYWGRMLGCTWSGRCYVNSQNDTSFRLWGSDCVLWDSDGLFIDSQSLTAPNTTFHVIFEYFEKATIGSIFCTQNATNGIRVNGGKDLVLRHSKTEANASLTAGVGAGIYITGGTVLLDRPWFYRLMGNPGVTGYGANGMLHVSGGRVTVRDPIFAEDEPLTQTYNHIYATGANTVVVVEGDITTLDYTTGASTPGRPFQYASASGAALVLQGTAAPQAFQPSDVGLLNCNFDPVAGVGTSTPLGVAGTLYAMRLRSSYSMLATNIVVEVKTAGVTLTAGQCFAAIYDRAGNLLAQTGDQATTWQSTGIKTMALSAPVTVPHGLFTIVLWANGTTLPAFARGNSSNVSVNGALAAGSSRFATADVGKTTTAPATLGALTAATVPYWVGVS